MAIPSKNLRLRDIGLNTFAGLFCYLITGGGGELF